MEITIQSANLDLAQTISELFQVLDTENYNFSKLTDIEEAINNKNCYVAMTDSKVVAAMVMKIDDQSYKLELLSSIKKGGGKALVDFATNKAKAEGIPKIWCWSLVRYNAKGFYEKMGFQEAYLLKKQWFGEDCFIFGKLV